MESTVKEYFFTNKLSISIAVLILVTLYASSVYNFLLFHSLAEFFSIIIAFCAFFIAWNSRKFMSNNYILFMGIAFAFFAIIDLVHILAYKGMNIFIGFDANLPTQLWIAARYMQGISFLIATFFINKKLNAKQTALIYVLITTFLLGSIFAWDIFPTSYVEGVGLTPFKIISEYVISGILIASLVLLYKKRRQFDSYMFKLLYLSIIFTILSELAFTFYISVYGFSNLIGHFFKIIAFYLVYKAVIETSLMKPYSTLFRKLKVKEEKLVRANKRLKELENLRGGFIMSLTHDLKQPLTPIIGYAELIKEHVKTQKHRKYLDRIVANSFSMREMINRLLNLMKLEATSLRLQFKRVKLSSLIRDAITTKLSVIKLKNIKVITELKKAFIIADYKRLREVIENKIDNAVKFSNKGGVIKLKTWLEGTNAVISIKDYGVGIRKKDLPKIYTKFYQTKEGSLAGGFGVGLALCKRVIKAHGGSIKVKSEYKKGTEFIITIPTRVKK